MFIKNSIIVLFFSTFLASTHSIIITVEDFETILDSTQFNQLKDVHKLPELTETYKNNYEVTPNSEEGTVILNTWQSYKKTPTEKWITQLKSKGHDNSPLLCIFGKLGLYYAYSINHDETKIANKTHSSLDMAKAIKDRANKWNDSNTDGYIGDISHGIMITNKLLDATEEVSGIMEAHPDATLLQLFKYEEDKFLLDNSIESTQYPEERVKTIIYHCKRHVVDYSIDTQTRIYTTSFKERAPNRSYTRSASE